MYAVGPCVVECRAWTIRKSRSRSGKSQSRYGATDRALVLGEFETRGAAHEPAPVHSEFRDGWPRRMAQSLDSGREGFSGALSPAWPGAGFFVCRFNSLGIKPRTNSPALACGRVAHPSRKHFFDSCEFTQGA
jgi:hypothetical protein